MGKLTKDKTTYPKMHQEREVRDSFILSEGNLIVFKTIPEMMTSEKWRKKLRSLVLDYIMEGVLKNKK